MKSYRIYLLSFFFLVIASSCNKDTEPAPPLSEANISALSFNRLKSDGNKEAFGVAFQITAPEAEDMGIIENADSLPYKTNVSALFPVFQPNNRFFAWKKNVDDEYEPVTNETFFDFSAQDSVFIRSTAPDGVAEAKYTLKVKVHQVDPDSMIWTKSDASIGSSGEISFAKAIVRNNEIYYYFTQDGISGFYMYDGGETWAALTGSFSEVLADVLLHQDKLYGLNDAGEFIYFDGMDWQRTALQLDALLFSIGGDLIAVQGNNTVKIVKVNETDFSATLLSSLPADFPTAKIQTCVAAESGYEVGYVISGNSNRIFFTNDNGSTWFDYSTGGGSQPFTAREVASIVSYDKKLWIIGGNELIETSLNKGLTWRAENKWQTQTENIYLPNQSAVVFDNSIYVIGTDGRPSVWKGRMNKKDFLIQ